MRVKAFGLKIWFPETPELHLVPELISGRCLLPKPVPVSVCTVGHGKNLPLKLQEGGTALGSNKALAAPKLVWYTEMELPFSAVKMVLNSHPPAVFFKNALLCSSFGRKNTSLRTKIFGRLIVAFPRSAARFWMSVKLPWLAPPLAASSSMSAIVCDQV